MSTRSSMTSSSSPPIGSDDGNIKRRSSSSRGGRLFLGAESSHMCSSSSSLSLGAFVLDQRRHNRAIVILSPREVLSSIHNDMTTRMIVEFVLCLAIFQFGLRGPSLVVLPMFMGGMMTMRNIPYQLTMAGDVLLDLTLNNEYLPKTDVIFPSDRLWLISLWIPLMTVLLLGSFLPLSPTRVHHGTITTTSSFVDSNNNNNNNNGPLSNAHAGSCVVLVGIGASELITQTTKFYVGRLRPNFYGMCGFDVSTLRCANGFEMEMESRMSFPSGHSSLSFAGSVCLVLFFLGRCGLGRTAVPTTRGRVVPMSSWWRRFAFVMSFSPLLISLWCATSRLVDNWHHPSDILAGSIVGTVSAFVSYHIWFPHVLSVHAGIPLSVISSAFYDDNCPSGDVGMTYLLGEKSLSLPTFDVA
ncbi:hypothetical protein ACHAXA_006391 [Cyclostephanos tholiformis]|uniref:Phosphatidic acid phosphatase type 2/haloperoxidase domain-containing protein n=1 Tax=Cyclostephanos tholiformis TaxID=382380 RepID=A0ABD3SDH3_9STRA